MNTQDIITPIGKFLEWSFETFLVPVTGPFNLATIALGLGGLVFWLRLQNRYNKEAKEAGRVA